MLWMLLSACVATKDEVKEEKISSMMSLSFPAYFLSQSLLPDIENNCFLPQGEDAQHWFPNPDQISGLQNNDLIVQMGSGYEAWVVTASLPSKKLLSLDKGLSTIPLTGQTHSHGSGGEHEHTGVNPFTWLDPDLYQEQLTILKDKLISFPVIDKDQTEKRYSALRTEISDLSASLQLHKGKMSAFQIAADSQSFAYLARALELEIKTFDFPEEEDFITKHLQEFMEWYVPEQKTLMLWSYEPSATLMGKFPSEIQHLHIDTLVQPVQNRSYQYVEQFSQNIKRISEL